MCTGRKIKITLCGYIPCIKCKLLLTTKNATFFVTRINQEMAEVVAEQR